MYPFRIVILIANILITVAFGQTLDAVNHDNLRKPLFISPLVKVIPNVPSLDVKCFNNLVKTISNIIPRNEIPVLELHVTCHTRNESAFRVVGDGPKPSLSCLQNATTVTHWLGSFAKNAVTLDLSNNCIKKIDVLPLLNMLNILILKHNSIEIIEHGAFENLPKLEILDLSYNSLTGDSLSWEVFRGHCKLTDILNSANDGDNSSNDRVKHCKQLEVRQLNLGHNRIQSIHPTTFKNIYNLRELILNHNPLSIADPNIIAGIKSITSLQVLHLSNLHLSSIPFRLVDGLKLKALYINSNNFTEVPEELSFLGRTLLFLNINDNPIKILNYDSFIGLSNLKELEVAGMAELTSVYEGAFSHLQSLETVILSYNPKLSFIDPYAFRWLSPSPSSVKYVYLQENNLKHLPVHLLPWSQLDKLVLSGNFWACNCELRWFLELTEKRNLNVMRDSGFKCAYPHWPNITAFDIYNRPIRNFNCGHTSSFLKRYRVFTMTERLAIVAFLTGAFLLVGTLLFRFIFQLSRTRSAAVDDLFTLSASLKNDFKYNRLKNKPIYNNISALP